MLERLSLITYVPSHGGKIGEESGLWVHPVGSSFEEFGTVGGKAVVLDACDTASERWLYDRGSLRAECRSLKGKPLLGGSGNAKPNEVHGEDPRSAPQRASRRDRPGGHPHPRPVMGQRRRPRPRRPRATAAVFRRHMLKPVGKPYDSDRAC
jgi:hypothetical protein